MRYYSYVVSRDYGFAPNPFGKFCTLATCKQRIRKSAKVGDWIFGITSRKLNNRLLYAMKVDDKLSYNDYWNDPRFQYKKPVMNGSLKQMYGDNIYFYNEEKKLWHQENSHHSLDNGDINNLNLERDTSGQFALVSQHFYYFGSDAVKIPRSTKDAIVIGIGYKIVENKKGKNLVNWLSNNYELGYHADPISFTEFERYDGVR
ncbi:MAG: hypothetical protein PVH88_16405 [Ignavibacteria bacterium]